MNLYLDTSALIKLVFAEEGSDVAGELWEGADIVASSQLVHPEARAAAAAAERGGRIDGRTLKQAVRAIDRVCSELRLIGVDAGLARLAGELAERHALRGYDAVHLATALSVDDRSLVVATWDRDLATAALACDRAVAPARR